MSDPFRWRPLTGMARTAAGLLLAVAASSRAADHFWIAGKAGYADAARWTGDGTVPGTGDHAFVNNGGTVWIRASDPSWSLNDLRAAESAGSTGAYLQSGGTVTAASWMRLGFGAEATGSYTLSGGILYMNNRMYLGGKDGSQASGGHGVLTITGGEIRQEGQYVTIGARSEFGHANTTGVVEHSGGIFRANGELYIGNGSLGAGTLAGRYRLSGSAALNLQNWFVIGRGGARGELLMTGGSVTKAGTGSQVILGIGATGRGTIRQSGGTFTNTVSRTWFAENGGAGSWHLSGDAQAVLGKVYLAHGANSTGEFHLDGGVLSVIHFDPAMADPAAEFHSSVHFNGGTLRARADESQFLPISVTQAEIQAGGAVIDSNGFQITIAKDLTSDGSGGGLTKTGAGTLLLRGANDYAGTTTVAQGALVLNGSIQSEAPTAPMSHGTIGTFACGSLTLSSSARMNVEINSEESLADLVVVAGDVDLGGAALEVADVGSAVLPAGTRLTLIEYSGTLRGRFSNVEEGETLEVGGNSFVVRYEDSSAVTLVVPGAPAGLAYEEWAEARQLPQGQRDPMEDPDRDGRPNLLEFALDGDPLSAADDGKTVGRMVALAEGGEAFVLTAPVRTGAVFPGEGPLVSGAIDGLVYVIEGSPDLVQFSSLPVREVDGTAEDALPALSPGWEYRSFQLAPAAGPRGFLRIRTLIPEEP